MLNTGYISFVSETGGGFDASGNPIPTTKSSTSFVPCSIMTITKEYKVLSDGQIQQAKFSIYVDEKEVTLFDLSAIIEVTIQDSDVNSLGTFQIQNKEHLKFSKKYKIIV